MTIEIPVIFVLGQLVTIIGFLIGWYIAHIRLKDRVNEMKHQCNDCRIKVNERFIKLENEVNDDLRDLKTDIKNLNESFTDFKFMFGKEITSLKTLITHKFYEGQQ